MTIFLVLGLFAGLYMIWLLFHLAVHALPVSAGIAGAFWMHGADHGYLASIAAGFGVGILVLVAGRILFGLIHAPILRFMLAMTFTVPAGIAGYHAVRGVAGLALDPGMLLSILSWGGAVVISASAWTRLGRIDAAGSLPSYAPTMTR